MSQTKIVNGIEYVNVGYGIDFAHPVGSLFRCGTVTPGGKCEPEWVPTRPQPAPPAPAPTPAEEKAMLNAASPPLVYLDENDPRILKPTDDEVMDVFNRGY